jgi:hypothetical protein
MKLPILILAAGLSATLATAADRYFGIRVVDAETGRGVPLVELRTVHGISYWTDSAGWVAFDEPGVMDEQVYFFVSADGYVYPEDGFGYRGFSVRPSNGGEHTVQLERVNVAERLYRLTGAGIYRDSHLLGLDVPMREPLLNGRVMGQDSTLAVEYRGQVYWFWGDTLQPSHPLGNFHMAMATSAAPGQLEPERAIDFTYFVDQNGFARQMAPMPGEGPTWLGGLTVIAGDERDLLVGGYSKIRNQLETYERGLVVYENANEIFVRHTVFPQGAPLYPIGHAMQRVEEGEVRVYFVNPLPLVRARADLDSLSDPATYEAFTPLREGSRLEDRLVERDSQGRVVYAWKKATPEVGPRDQEALIEAGVLDHEEALFAVRDWRTGKPVRLHAGSVNWSDYRGRWVLTASEIFGDSVLGELWMAEADSPLGPWVYGQKIVSHEKYTFYNPRHHPFLDREGGRIIYFEGTYTALFSGVERPTPRYDYNQILYRLDLADPRLDLPVAVYSRRGGCLATAANGAEVLGRPLFWGWERGTHDRVGVKCGSGAGERCRLEVAEGETALFFALREQWESAFPHAQSSFKMDGATLEVPGWILPHPMLEGPVLPAVSGVHVSR